MSSVSVLSATALGKQSNRFLILLVLSLGIAFSGCSQVISPDIKATADFTLTFKEVFENPDAYKGRIVLWGGDIIQVINQDDGTALIEILERSLGNNEEPLDIDPPEGRFLVLVDKHLNPSVYHKDREITVAGEIQGKTIKPLGKTPYQYPLISSEQIYLWKERNRWYLPFFQQYSPPYTDPCSNAPWWWCID
jgi:outer membrane lipoprotein